jgi:hypothetical protein
MFQYLKLKGVLVTFQLGVARCTGCRLKKKKKERKNKIHAE